jgi:hypothetical protein
VFLSKCAEEIENRKLRLVTGESKCAQVIENTWGDFCALVKSAEFLENKCILLGPEDGISNPVLPAESKPRTRRNRAEAQLLDVCAAAWRVTAAIFSMRINHYLMAVKRGSDLEEGHRNCARFHVMMAEI